MLTSGERITYAGPSDGLPDASVDRVLDASGKFVVPGLIDLHTHSTFDADMQTYLKNGVTSIRFAGVSQAAVVAVRERIQRGEVTGPRIFSCGPMLDKSPPAYPQWTSTVNTPAEADRTARRLLSHDRVEALLVTQQITPDLLEPVVSAAHEFGRPVVGQVWATDGAQADLGTPAAPTPDFNFAATSVNPSSGIAAGPAPSTAAGSVAPQLRVLPTGAVIKNNHGYRALAAILLAALLLWAWRQAVPPRPDRRTIYDGPPA